MSHGYKQRRELRRFQLVRQVLGGDRGRPIDVIVDFLMPRHAEIVRNVPPLIDGFAVQRASGADLALRFHQMVAIDGPMAGGGKNRVEIAVASIPALLAMKGFAVQGRYNWNRLLNGLVAVSGIRDLDDMIETEIRTDRGHAIPAPARQWLAFRRSAGDADRCRLPDRPRRCRRPGQPRLRRLRIPRRRGG